MTFVPSDFEVPSCVDLEVGRLRLLTMADVASDHAVFVRNRSQLDGVYDPNDTPWPDGAGMLSLSFARLGYCEWQRFNLGSFCYGVINSQDTRQIGRLHVEPSANPDFDSQAIFWACADDCSRNIQLLDQARDWLAGTWPFETVAMPGRTESWEVFTRPLLVPREFEVPERVHAEGFLVRFMSMDDYVEDYTASTSSWSEIRSVYNPDYTEWPEVEVTLHDNLAALGAVEWEHFQRLLFTYGVMTPDNSRQMGCIYVAPAGKGGFDAEVSYWVRKEEYETGFHDHLSAWLENWIETSWPFKNPAIPGSSMSWEEWNRMTE